MLLLVSSRNEIPLLLTTNGKQFIQIRSFTNWWKQQITSSCEAAQVLNIIASHFMGFLKA